MSYSLEVFSLNWTKLEEVLGSKNQSLKKEIVEYFNEEYEEYYDEDDFKDCTPWKKAIDRLFMSKQYLN